MKFQAAATVFSALSFVSAAPTLYICSDSTTANYATGGALQGYNIIIPI
jgi:hypothetical protein